MGNNADQIIAKLDTIFTPSQFPPDMPFSRSMPRIYDAASIDFIPYITDAFAKNFNGLMVNNTDRFDTIYLSVFLSEEALDKVFSENISNVLVFTHHPTGMETRGRGFIPLRRTYFEKMRERNISVYSVHTPLDVNEKFSPSSSIAKRLGLINLQRYDHDGIGYHGSAGELPNAVSFEDFIVTLSGLFEVSDINYIKRKERIKKVGVIAGGGADVQYIRETIDLGCDTYLTGDFVNKVQNEYSLQKRREFEEARDRLDINMIECSHYATEKIVLQHEIKDLFNGIGLPVHFISQDNPWY